MMAQHQLNGRLLVMRSITEPVEARTHGDRVVGVVVRGLESVATLIEAAYMIDATPFGDLIALGRRGARARCRVANRDWRTRMRQKFPIHKMGQQAITTCFAMERVVMLLLAAVRRMRFASLRFQRLGVEHVLGAESCAETGEPHAAEFADPRGQQAITTCFAMEHFPAKTTSIERANAVLRLLARLSIRMAGPVR